MAATDIVFNGFYYAVGRTLTATIGGLDAGDYIVDIFGNLTVPINQDPDQLCNGAYLTTLDVGPFDTTTYGAATTAVTLQVGAGEKTIYIPVVIGYTYPSLGRTVRPITAEATQSKTGPGVAKMRRPFQYGALLNKTQGVSIGGSFSNMRPAALVNTNGAPLLHSQTFSGVAWDTLDGDYDFDGFVCWQVTRPYPMTLVALTGFIRTADR